MSKYSTDFKLTVVRYYLSERTSYQATAVHFSVDLATVRKWVAVYEHHGIDGLNKRYAHHSPEFKMSVLKWIETEHASVRQACAHFNIRSLKTVRDWQRLYNAGGILALTSKQQDRTKNMSKPFKPASQTPDEMTQEELLRELQYLRAENAYLKKLDALVRSRLSAPKTKRKS
jgi:transposase